MDQASIINFLSNEDTQELAPGFFITQNCDIVATAEKEPYFAFLIGRAKDGADKNLFYGKNPRLFQAECNGEIFEFSIHDIFRVRKEDFVKHKSRKSKFRFSNDTIKQILRWISKRYTRPAFPDAFNSRLDNKKLENLSKEKICEKISIVLLDVCDDELPKELNYKIQIFIGIENNIPEQDKTRIEELFSGVFMCEGIVVEDIRISEEIDITLRELRSYKRWDKDYRSLP
ncbi:MAG: hypothetical protein LBB83_06615, partial [Treponema sp.]|nr:hypothetical protein [Treponema sp.]